MTMIKVCGITRIEDAEICVEAGVDLLGFIFAERSPRRILPEACQAIIRALPAGKIRTVGVFVDTPPVEVLRTVTDCGLDLVQLHGSECPAGYSDLPVGVIRSISVRSPASFDVVSEWKSVASFFLFDNASGGSGAGFDWRLLESFRASGGLDGSAFFLAGGLSEGNLPDALRLGPDGVDINSGVESAPGIKDAGKIRRVVRIVRSRR
jgi:phosphoribosylanthranilate isomerase